MGLPGLSCQVAFHRVAITFFLLATYIFFLREERKGSLNRGPPVFLAQAEPSEGFPFALPKPERMNQATL